MRMQSPLPALAETISATLALLAGCTGPPGGVEPVGGFQIERYMGTWYEIARLDHSFERGLTHVTASYTLTEDGGVQVVNRGWNAAKGRWSQAEGKARFRGDSDLASLEVTFFWPFYGGYHVILLDPDYQWALVCGQSRGYLWILARSRKIDQATQARLIDHAKGLGFATEELIFVAHDRDEVAADSAPPVR